MLSPIAYSMYTTKSTVEPVQKLAFIVKIQRNYITLSQLHNCFAISMSLRMCKRLRKVVI
jgi:hypothetical protein